MAKKTSDKLEQSMGRLEEIITKMEGDEGLSLEDTFALYGEGLKLVQTCTASIDGIEKKLETLMNVE